MMNKKDLLNRTVKHVDATKYDSTPIIDSMREMSFTSRDTARAADILKMMLEDQDCTTFLTLAGSTSAGGCMNLYADMIRYNMIDAVVATGAAIVDMDFFEALGFQHYHGTPFIDDHMLRDNYIDRIYDTFIDEEQLQSCDATVKEIADGLEPRPYSSREFIREMGRYLTTHARKKDSLVELAFKNNVPIFCPAFSDSSAGFGLVMHQATHPKEHVSIDSVKDFYELTRIKMKAKTSGLFMVGGGGTEELRPGHRGVRRVPGKGRAHAPVRDTGHRGRRAGRRLLQLHAEGGQLVGQGGDHLRADGVRRGHHRGPPHLLLRVPQRGPEEASPVRVGPDAGHQFRSLSYLPPPGGAPFYHSSVHPRVA